MAGRIRACILMQEPCRGQHKVTLPITPCEPFLALHQPRVNRYDARVLFARVHDMLRVSQWGLRIEQVVAPRCEADPFPVWGKMRHVLAEGGPSILHGGRHSGLPLVKGLPGRLNGANDAFFKVGAVLLHYDDRFLEGVFFVDLFLELAGDGCICYVAVE